MVKRGLEVGSVFTDGNRTYMVDKVLPNGSYISHSVPKVTKPKKENSTSTGQKNENGKEK